MEPVNDEYGHPMFQFSEEVHENKGLLGTLPDEEKWAMTEFLAGGKNYGSWSKFAPMSFRYFLII